MKSQNQQILEHLQKGASINPLQALDLFGCFRLAARIGELKNNGHNIRSQMVYPATGKKYAFYWMDRLDIKQ